MANDNAKIIDQGDINRMPDVKSLKRAEYNTLAYQALEAKAKIMAQDPKQRPTIYPNYQNDEPVVKNKNKKKLKRGHKKKAAKKKVSQV